MIRPCLRLLGRVCARFGPCSECGRLGFRMPNQLRVRALVGDKWIPSTWTYYRCRRCAILLLQRQREWESFSD